MNANRAEITRATVAYLTAVADGDYDAAAAMIIGLDHEIVMGVLTSLLLLSWRDLSCYDGELVGDRLRRIGAHVALIP